MKIKNLLINPLRGGIPANESKLMDNVNTKIGFIIFIEIKLLNSKKE